MKNFPYGINKIMDSHAAENGFSHWSCVSPDSNEWWVRKDGKSLEATFLGKDGYLTDLAKFDSEFPIAED